VSGQRKSLQIGKALAVLMDRQSICRNSGMIDV
jgi:hypothetical protein